MTSNHTLCSISVMWLRIAAVSLSAAALPAAAQLSLASSVDLALRSSPRVKMAQAELIKSQALVAEAKDVYVPALNVGAGLGQSYGYSTNPPTLFTITAQSLVYSSSQFDYIRSARAGFAAASASLQDARNSVMEDTALAFVALAHDEQREAVLRQQFELAGRLVSIEEDRFNAGRDTQLDLTSARLTAAQFKLARLHAEDTAGEDREHLARLLDLPSASLHVDAVVAPMLPGDPVVLLSTAPQTPAVLAAFLSAHAKQELAFADSRFLYRPQVSLFLQYSRYATFADSFKQLTTVYGHTIGANEEAFGVQISVPIFDRYRQAKARESAAEAARALHEAELAQFLSLDSRLKLSHSLLELQARAEVAALDQQLAQQQLDALTTQLNIAAAQTGPPLSPKDEQNSRIAEREKYLNVLDYTFQLQQARISLLRQSGQLEQWLRQPALTHP